MNTYHNRFLPAFRFNPNLTPIPEHRQAIFRDPQSEANDPSYTKRGFKQLIKESSHHEDKYTDVFNNTTIDGQDIDFLLNGGDFLDDPRMF